MDPPAAAFQNTNYNECDIFPVNGDQTYAIFYENKGQNTCGLKQKTEQQIIDEIRFGRNLQHGQKGSVEGMDKDQIQVVYMDCAGSMVIQDVLEKFSHDVLLFTDVRSLDFNTWEMFAGSEFSVLHMPCFKKDENCTGYGGITILYRKTLKVVNHSRIFTWKLLNTEKGRVFPGVEGVFIDVTKGPTSRVNRICTMFHWKHSNSKAFDPRVNVTNFVSNFLTKPIPPANDLPLVVHIFGRFNLPADEDFKIMVKAKHAELQFIQLDHPDISVLTTGNALFSRVSNDPHEIFSFELKLL